MKNLMKTVLMTIAAAMTISGLCVQEVDYLKGSAIFVAGMCVFCYLGFLAIYYDYKSNTNLKS